MYRIHLPFTLFSILSDIILWVYEYLQCTSVRSTLVKLKNLPLWPITRLIFSPNDNLFWIHTNSQAVTKGGVFSQKSDHVICTICTWIVQTKFNLLAFFMPVRSTPSRHYPFKSIFNPSSFITGIKWLLDSLRPPLLLMRNLKNFNLYSCKRKR